MILTTTPTIEGRRIEKYLGIVSGTDIYLVGGVLGGGLANQENLFGFAHRNATEHMKRHAAGADAIVGIHTEVLSPGNLNNIIVVVTGTAVKLEPTEEEKRAAEAARKAEEKAAEEARKAEEKAAEEKERERLEKQLRLDAYWAARPEEEAQLYAERNALAEEIAALNKKRDNHSAAKRRLEILNQISELKTEYYALGAFKKTEKLALEQKIAALNEEVDRIAAAADAEMAPLWKEIQAKQARLAEIDKRLASAEDLPFPPA